MIVTPEVFACHTKACAPPPVGVGGSRAAKSNPNSAVSKAFESMRRTQAGPGASAAPTPDAPADIKLKSIPNLPTERLERGLAALHSKLHTPEGMKAHDGPRRDLIDGGVKAKAIAHELRLRGHKEGDCALCWKRPLSAVVAACYSAACRPPSSGGTGGSSPSGSKGSREALQKVAPVLDALKRAGGTPYVVGGFVRDGLLGLTSKDLDIEVHGLPADKVSETLKRLGKVDEVGKSFGVLKITYNGEDLDVSLPRTDSKTGTGHTGFEVSVDPHMGIEKALSRRDFTINAIAMDSEGNLVDPHGGAAHMKERKLTAVSDAFSEDPLRVLRGVQFAGRFGMTMDDRTAEMSRQLLDEIDQLPKERIWGEFEKIGAKGKDFSAVAKTIEQTGLQGRFGNIRPANPNLKGLEGEHRVAVALAAIGADPRKIGATNNVTQRMDEISSALAFRGTAAESRAFARTLKLSTFSDAQRVDPSLRFDPKVANGPTAPLVSGKDLIARGIKPGPEFGRLLREITAAQDRGDVKTQAQALKLLDQPYQ